MALKDQIFNRLSKKAGRGMRGWPLAAITCYGPDGEARRGLGQNNETTRFHHSDWRRRSSRAAALETTMLESV